MINNVMLVSGVQQSDSVIHIHVSILFQILFPFRLLQNLEQCSLCYTVQTFEFECGDRDIIGDFRQSNLA